MLDDGMPDRWLSLSEASALLGVHGSTLRRWADAGRVPSRRTPGGHRRFSLQRLRPYLGPSERTAGPAEAGALEAQPWYSALASAGFADRFRALGQRVSGAAMQYMIAPEEDARYLVDGLALGREYGRLSATEGIPLDNAVRAFVFFRRRLLDVLARVPSTDLSGTHGYAHYDTFMSEVLVGLVAGFEERRNGAT
jgi:excisionase family DNA binding protein